MSDSRWSAGMAGGGLLAVLACLASGVLATEGGPPVVETPLGRLRGDWATSRGGRRYAAFRGLPYAKPPLGPLRLKGPEPAEAWNGTRDALTNGPFCIQANTFIKNLYKEDVIGLEDCLYLSVYTPNISGSAPVFVHFHGGGFIMGNSKWYRPTYLMDEDIVVVNVNYRLGIFGFLTFETEELRGNQGLKDQAMALRWVRQNIAYFGGDPGLVTLNGESAGGASVYHHIVSPASKGLFHRAIAESGTSYSPWALAVPGAARANAERLMKLIGCPTQPKEAIPCLMQKDAVNVTRKFLNFISWQIDPINVFGPSLEPAGPEAFLTGPISSWQHSPVPLLIGANSAEGLIRTLIFLNVSGTDLSWLTEVFDSKAPMSLMYESSASKPEEVTRKLRQFYLPKENITIQDWFNLTTLYGDAWFLVSILEGADKHKGDVYFYYFDYIVHNNLLPEPLAKKLIFGASHADELAFIWDMEGFLNLTRMSEEDLKLSRKLLKVVVNFANHGLPGKVDENLQWNKWTENDHSFMHIDNAGFHFKKGLAEERYSFWKSLDYRSKYDNTLEENLV